MVRDFHSDRYFFIQDSLSDPLLQFVHIFLKFFAVTSLVFEMRSCQFQVFPGQFVDTRVVIVTGTTAAIEPVRVLKSDTEV